MHSKEDLGDWAQRPVDKQGRDLSSHYRVLLQSEPIVTDREILDWMENQAYVEATSNDLSDSGSGARVGFQWQRHHGTPLREAIIKVMLRFPNG